MKDPGSSALKRRRSITAVASVFAVLLPGAGVAALQAFAGSDDEPIRYSATKPTDPIAQLQKKIDSGQVKLAYDPQHGYLPAVLRSLGLTPASQTLVFSKTSFQRDLISPSMPRALYFNDSTYIGWVQGGRVVEVSTVDPQLGAVFYTLDQTKTDKPVFVRQTHECLQCHESNMTTGIPGHVMRSVYTRVDGQPELRAGSFVTTDQSPLRERWGGWYVSGTHGSMRHMGNTMARGDNPEDMDLERGANVTDLKKLVDTSPYLGRHSDIVALMVMEHQTRVQNLITRANYETRRAILYAEGMAKALGQPVNTDSDSVKSRIKSVCEPLVQAMLFVKEEPLTAPVAGTSGFTAQFAGQGPRDSQGRSLREFDLKTRMFKYPCSYLVYSEAFDGLPAPAKEYVYRRLWEVLTAKEKSAEFEHLTEADRIAVREILTATKPDFAKWAEAQSHTR